jgi:hypothetical protein
MNADAAERLGGSRQDVFAGTDSLNALVDLFVGLLPMRQAEIQKGHRWGNI